MGLLTLEKEETWNKSWHSRSALQDPRLLVHMEEKAGLVGKIL